MANISPHWDCYAMMYILLKQILFFRQLVNMALGFPGGSVVKNPLANATLYLWNDLSIILKVHHQANRIIYLPQKPKGLDRIGHSMPEKTCSDKC